MQVQDGFAFVALVTNAFAAKPCKNKHWLVLHYEAWTLQSECRVLVGTDTCMILAQQISDTRKPCQIFKYQQIACQSWVLNKTNVSFKQT